MRSLVKLEYSDLLYFSITSSFFINVNDFDETFNSIILCHCITF